MPKKPYRSSGKSDNRRDRPDRSNFHERDERSSDKPRGNQRYGSRKNEPTSDNVERAYRNAGSGERKFTPHGDGDNPKRRNPTGKNFSTEKDFSKPRYPKRNDEHSGDFKERKSYGDAERKPYQRRDNRNEGFKRNDNRDQPFRSRDDNREARSGERGHGAPDRRASHFEKREQDRSRSHRQRNDYGDRPPRPFDRDERRNEKNDESRERNSYNRDNDAYRKASSNNERYNPRRKTFGNQDNDTERPKRTSYGDRDNQFKPRGAKPFVDKRSFDQPFERKPNGDRPFRERPSFADNDRAGYKPRKRVPSKHENRFDDTPEPNEKLAPKTGDDGTLRLNKYIANAGVCSRREADEHIAAGEVKVNGEVVTEMGHRVKPSDTITFRGKRVHYGKKVYILLNKPKDYITTTEDERDRKTVMEILGDATDERVYPVGRLDRNTTGLLLLTNDGELAQKLMHPSFRVRKVYQVTLDKPVAKEDMEKIAEGVELEDGKALVDEIAFADPKDKRVVGIDLHIGKNRIVRRIFESLGYDVLNLDRVLYAGLTKKDLPRGKWRFLTDKEITQLYQHMKRAPKKKPQG